MDCDYSPKIEYSTTKAETGFLELKKVHNFNTFK